MARDRSFSLKRWLTPGLLASSVLLAAPAASAVEINVYYVEDQFNPDDPYGTQLLAIGQAAATLWEQLLPVNGQVYNVEIGWESWNDSTLGEAWADPWGNISIEMSPSQGTKEWFIDSSPLDHGEFDLQQKLFRDLTPGQQDVYFDGNPPALLEVGFRGPAKDGTGAGGKFDLLSVVLHEMGHIVGVNYAWSEDYDITPDFIGGIAGVEVASDVTHIEDAYALMASTTSLGKRTLPSAVDLFCIADDEDYTSVRLNRMDFLGNALQFIPSNLWDFGINWEGGSPPEADDTAFLRHGGPIDTLNDQVVSNLTVGDTGGGPLTRLLVDGGAEVGVHGLTTIQVDGQIDLDATGGVGLLITRNLAVMGGHLSLTGGTARVGRAIQVGPDGGVTGRISGRGLVELREPATLINNGMIHSLGGALGPLVVASQNQVIPTLDLDGDMPEGGHSLVALDGDLDIDGIETDPFDGIIEIGDGRTMDFARGLAVGSEGQVHLVGANGPATISTSGFLTLLGVQGSIVAAGHGVVDSALELRYPALLGVTQGATLTLAGSTVLDGAAVDPGLRDGMIRQLGDVNVTGDTVLEVETYDWDGLGGSATTIQPKVAFTLVVEHLNDGGDLSFGGTINNVGGNLIVLTKATGGAMSPWTLVPGGLLVLDPVEEIRPMVQGTNFNVFGHVTGTGNFLVDVLNRGGVVEPAGESGKPIGEIAVTDKHDYTQSHGSALLIDLAGEKPESYDRLVVQATAHLGGTLEVSLAEGFVPVIGDHFDVVVADTIDGTFDSVILPPIPIDFEWEVEYLSTPGGQVVRLSVVPHS